MFLLQWRKKVSLPIYPKRIYSVCKKASEVCVLYITANENGNLLAI